MTISRYVRANSLYRNMLCIINRERMDTCLMAFIEFFIVLLLVVIIYNAYKKNNAELSLHLNIVILFVAVLKLLYLIYLSMNKISLCEATQSLYCSNS